jgi:hypothetical protein
MTEFYTSWSKLYKDFMRGLIEFFITKHLKLKIKEFPASHLIELLKDEIRGR